MKFDRTTVTISINKSTKEIFEKANMKKPPHISMSTWIAVMIEDYLKNHKENANILDFADKSVESSLPIFFAPINKWEEKVRVMSPEEFSKLQDRLYQIGNLVEKESSRRC
jgi:PHD/YefM family antitoxin component YafN of YafNO toxin-antitoxin module|tara:strand:+ start:371 stop:703 length:333 start_codon:yes stop_codon:yes gene_type:complete